eukprot:scaffold13904_cov83-Phaeocystis_antarctica.AAC.1
MVLNGGSNRPNGLTGVRTRGTSGHTAGRCVVVNPAGVLISAELARVASTPAQYRGPQVFVPDTPETRAPSSQPPGFLAGTELSVAGLHTQQLRAPATPAARRAGDKKGIPKGERE